MLPIWPAEGANELVPVLEDICAVPASPELFGLLYENAGWSTDLEAGALGVLHRQDEAVATFSVTRVREGTPGLDQAAGQMGDASIDVGDLTVSWRRAGSHVATFWIDELDIVTIAGEDEEAVTDATSAWLVSAGHDGKLEAPSDIPEAQPLPEALEQGPPLDDLPDGYIALDYDPLMFLASDFADTVTIHEEESVEGLGAAVVLTHEREWVGTVIAATNTDTRGELSRWPAQLHGAAADGFASGDVDILIVGHDQGLVSDLIALGKTTWDRSVATGKVW